VAATSLNTRSSPDLGEYCNTRTRKKREMHDFCFTIPYGVVVLVGGLVGYWKKGSTASLAGGVGSGLLLLLAGFVSLKAFEKRRKSYLAMIIETGSDQILSLA